MERIPFENAVVVRAQIYPARFEWESMFFWVRFRDIYSIVLYLFG